MAAEAAALAALVSVPVAALGLAVPVVLAFHQLAEGRAVRVPVASWWALSFTALVLCITLFAVAVAGAQFLLQLPPGPAFQVPSMCKVLAKDVDLRTARLCRQEAIGPLEFRCRLEYYWTSVLQVEFYPRTVNRPMHAAAEAPPQLLPAHCRPDFKAAWRTKEHYKINSTYPCKYSPGNLRGVEMARDFSHDCSFHEPTRRDLWFQFWLWLSDSDHAVFSVATSNGQLYLGALSGVCLGIGFVMLAHLVSLAAFTLHRRRLKDRPHSDISRVLYQARACCGLFSLWVMVVTVIVGAVSEVVGGQGLKEAWRQGIELICGHLGCSHVLRAAGWTQSFQRVWEASAG